MFFDRSASSYAIPLLILAATIVPDHSDGQDKLKPGRLPSEIRKQLKPGLKVDYSSPSSKETVSTHVRLPALFLRESVPPSPWISDSQFTATYTGYLKLKLKGKFEFSLAGQGSAKLAINDELVIDQTGELDSNLVADVELVKGYNKFQLVYSSAPQGDRQLRVYWKAESFAKEPIPPTVFFVQRNQPELEKGELAYHGRFLVSEHHCVKCHPAENPVDPLLETMDTPDLRISAGRVEKKWLTQWIAKPTTLRNEVSMPHLLNGAGDPDQVAADLASYLMSLQTTVKNGSSSLKGDIERGGDAFENLGCIGCHRFTPPEEEDEYGRLSLFFLNAKFREGGLSEFLKDSRKHYRWSKMPKFQLTDQESVDLAAYIRDSADGKLEADSIEGNPSNGGKKFMELGCSRCHDVGVENKPDQRFEKSFGTLTAGAGCLADSPEKGTPGFEFSESEKDAINQFVGSQPELPFQKITDADFAFRQFTAMRCVVCHDLDDRQASLPYIIEEEGVVGLPPNRVPMLTFAGEKLLTQWSQKILTGKLDYRVREHFRVRMPGFPERGKKVALGLAHQHGFADQDATPFQPQANQVKTGASVAAMETGLSCNRCHAIADKKPNAAFDAQSTNLVYAAKRLRKEYYLRWMFDPLRIDRQTKMPKFSEDGKTTSLKTVLGGDAEQQFQAIWQYLHSIKAPQK